MEFPRSFSVTEDQDARAYRVVSAKARKARCTVRGIQLKNGETVVMPCLIRQLQKLTKGHAVEEELCFSSTQAHFWRVKIIRHLHTQIRISCKQPDDAGKGCRMFDLVDPIPSPPLPPQPPRKVKKC